MLRLLDDPHDEALVGAWDFAVNLTETGVRDVDSVYDRSQHRLHGRLVNVPTRGVTGHNWSGAVFDFRHAKGEYDAIHFHEDDVGDSAWEPSLELTTDEQWQSGVYAVRITASIDSRAEEFIPFVVRPRPGRPTAKVGLLLPTATYLAYANQRTLADEEEDASESAFVPVLGKEDLALHIHREWGASTYDLHLDHSGICYASWLRPVVNIRPKYRHPASRVWQLNADLHLIDWLEHLGVRVDVLSDQDLHEEGTSLIKPYEVLLTGTHPEYCSSAMLDALEGYISTGGNMMYLGGNGFYWVIAFHPENRNIIEVRRFGGSEPWASPRGEGVLSFSAEMGGTWRGRGRDPEKLVGVGNIAQGLEGAGYYVRHPDSYAPEVSWIFDGVDARERIGAFGLEGGGAAGMEIDSFNPRRGSPDHVYVLATSAGHGSLMMEVRENQGFTRAFAGAATNPRVHGDMIYFRVENGGAVFSTGSISWCASLSHNEYENEVSQLTENVLRRFMRDDRTNV
jgi:N,N-dimethylformamidase